MMAEECGLARTQFAHYVKKLVNASPAEYLATLRLDAAEELLRERKDLDIGEIAARCGFRSRSYFATKFRASRGVSPSALRE
jgi:AraC family L-rhamnose operon regulatory protein RhaS